MLDLLLWRLLLLRWGRKYARSRLNSLWRGLRLENGIVAQTFALALLAVATGRMALVTLDSAFATG